MLVGRGYSQSIDYAVTCFLRNHDGRLSVEECACLKAGRSEGCVADDAKMVWSDDKKCTDLSDDVLITTKWQRNSG